DQFGILDRLIKDEMAKRDCKYRYCFLRANQSLPKELETDDDDEENRVRRINYVTIHSDTDLIKILKPMRLIVDLSARPEIFLQVVGISTGIPQINLVESDYVDDGKNGLRIGSVSDLGGALHYYLDGLSNWNRAKMYSVGKINSYTAARIVKELSDAVGRKG
ncbi:MAG: accessory Sec system glycosyltransferase Asp1, partial [Lactobacillus delbrueckii]|nr:accessory Sec system glycosyltransferase Asp1 [Lactobacillus delbrueckii]